MHVSATTVQDLIDAAMLKREREEQPRNYLGASRWGEDCTRRLAYEFHQTPIDGEDQFPAAVLRVFDMGHDAESRMAGYLKLAGFDLAESDPQTRKQWEFFDADGRLGGHCDGKLLGGPALALAYPLVWENKALNDSSWRHTRDKGLMISKPVYWGQLQTYMAYLGGSKCKGALITVLNRDSGAIYSELVPFNLQAAQLLSDRALRVVETEDPEEEPRLSGDPSFWKCGMCPYRKRCHRIVEIAYSRPVPAFPAWLQFN